MMQASQTCVLTIVEPDERAKDCSLRSLYLIRSRANSGVSWHPCIHTYMDSTSPDFQLDRGERLVWSGAPRQGLFLRPTDAFMIPFSVLWAGFAVFWEISVLRTPAPGFFAVWGIPFVAMGAYITVGRFFVDSWRRARTRYALSTDRVIIRTSTSLKSLSLRTLTDVALTEHRNGTGTITFGSLAFPMSMVAGASWPGVPQVPTFEQISGARQVYAQIREAQQASASRAS